MAWTSPRTWSSAEVVTAAMLNQQIRDNMLESATAKATASGQLFYAVAANSITTLNKGTANQYLRMNAGGTAPEWRT